MKLAQYTYWSLTINNPDDNDKLIVENPNEKYVRQLIWTPEKGADGTEHIQAFVRMQRNVGLSFMKKIYPRAHLKYVDRDEYLRNSVHYAQKNDETTQGKHYISINDPIPNADSTLYKVLERTLEVVFPIEQKRANIPETYKVHHFILQVNEKEFMKHVSKVERAFVQEKAGYEKIFCSPTYERMKDKFWKDILVRIYITPNAESASRSTAERKEEEELNVSDSLTSDEEGSGR